MARSAFAPGAARGYFGFDDELDEDDVVRLVVDVVTGRDVVVAVLVVVDRDTVGDGTGLTRNVGAAGL